jgi:CO/xanthine dehydrogenase Mo-binding subunit
MERLMDRAAVALQIDPAELRMRNLVRADEFPYSSPAGSLLDSGDYQGALALGLRQVGYEALRAEQEKARSEGRLFGIGMSCGVETSASNMAYVNLGPHTGAAFALATEVWRERQCAPEHGPRSAQWWCISTARRTGRAQHGRGADRCR